MAKKPTEFVALHEAGRAVAAVHFAGVRSLRLATIVPSYDVVDRATVRGLEVTCVVNTVGRAEHSARADLSPRNRILVLLAGPMAEAYARRRPIRENGYDVVAAAVAARRRAGYGLVPHGLWMRALAFVRKHQREIRHVAAALLKRHTLSGHEVAAIMRGDRAEGTNTRSAPRAVRLPGAMTLSLGTHRAEIDRLARETGCGVASMVGRLLHEALQHRGVRLPVAGRVRGQARRAGRPAIH